MIAVWPSTLPLAPLVQGYTESAPNLLLRSSVDQGPPRVRRKCSSKPWVFSAKLPLNAAQVQALEEFVYVQLEGGALRFEFAHARTKATVECRFVPKSEEALYVVSPRGTALRWQADVVLEVLP